MAEIQKLAQALARLLSLKQQGKQVEAEQGIDELLETDFGILFTDLIQSSEDDFEAFLMAKDFSAEKLDMLSQLLYLRFETEELSPANLSIAQHLKLIYQTLETKHRVVNMVNIGRQKNVLLYLNQNS